MDSQAAVLDMLKQGTLAYLEGFPNEILTMSFDEYWDNELKNEYKSQFFNNKVTTIIPYTSQNHNQLVLKTIRTLGDYVDNKRWKMASETRPVWIPNCSLTFFEESTPIKRKGYQLTEMTPLSNN